MSKSTAITELPPSPGDEQRFRVIQYTITMGIRLVCIVLAIVLSLTLHEWWWVIPAVGATVLPYFGVVMANTVNQRRGSMVVARPGSLVRVDRDEDAA